MSASGAAHAGTALLGSTCSTATDCTSGFCVDGYCCDQACTGQREACDVNGAVGTCVAATGAPHGARTPCPGTGAACDKECDGADLTTCNYPGTLKACASTCNGGSSTPSECNGAGTCLAAALVTCQPFACNVATGKCFSTCAKDSDCSTGNSCYRGSCVPRPATCLDDQTSMSTSGSRDGGVTNCAPYVCDHGSGDCLKHCTAVTDCVSPAVCNMSGECVAPPSGSSVSSGGCNVAPGLASDPGPLALVGLGLLAARRRRRRRPLVSASERVPRP